jgi:hypothetical protein
VSLPIVTALLLTAELFNQPNPAALAGRDPRV